MRLWIIHVTQQREIYWSLLCAQTSASKIELRTIHTAADLTSRTQLFVHPVNAAFSLSLCGRILTSSVDLMFGYVAEMFFCLRYKTRITHFSFDIPTVLLPPAIACMVSYHFPYLPKSTLGMSEIHSDVQPIFASTCSVDQGFRVRLQQTPCQIELLAHFHRERIPA